MKQLETFMRRWINYPAGPKWGERLPDAVNAAVAARGIVVDSITELPPDIAGHAVIAASHGGLYSARCGLAAAVKGAIFCDAGIGRERAGVAGLALLDDHDVPAAAIGHASARIGDGADCMARGLLSVVNKAAGRLGIRVGMSASAAIAIMQSGPGHPGSGPERNPKTTNQISAGPPGRGGHLERECGATKRDPSAAQVRFEITDYFPVPVVAIDSNSLVDATDAEAVVLTGSHGGLLGGRSEKAIKHRVFAVVYNDADVGADGAGVSRLGALDDLEIPAATVSAWSARIGDGRSTYSDGFITHVNRTAIALGGERGMSSSTLVGRLAEAWIKTRRSSP